MQGIAFIIDQLGQTVMAKDQQIAKLTAENEQLKAQVAEGQPADAQEGSQ